MTKQKARAKMKERLTNILEIDNVQSVISPWEYQFLASVTNQVNRGRGQLSQKQLDIVHRIESKIEKVTKGDPEWEASWDVEKEWNFRTAVAYYKNSPERYFSQILDWFDNHQDKIPPQNFYKKVVENKYAQRVLTSLRSEPKYPAGSTVMLRMTARTGLSYYVFQDHRNIPLFVIEPTDRAVSAAAGCRIYTVLSSISSKVFEVEERWIKKYREPKNKVKTHTCKDVPF